AVGIEQEGREIGRAVVVPVSGGAIVTAAGLEALGVKFLDRGMVRGAKGDMRAGVVQALVEVEPQRRLALRPEARAVRVLRAQDIAERRERGGVEAHRRIKVADFQSDMVVHDDLPLRARSSRPMEITYSIEPGMFLEILAHPARGLPEFQRR